MSDPVSSKSGREALRGAEVLAFNLIFEALSSEQLAELLRAPLRRAAFKGNGNLAKRLVGAGAGIGDALHEAIIGGHGEIVSDLVESGAPLATKNAHGNTPLHVAAGRGETEMVQLLLLKGADKDAFDTHERTPLFVAARFGHSAATLALLTAGADVSLRCCESKIPVTHAAAIHGDLEILRAVIEHGADVDAACTGYHMDSIDVLVEAGANIEARDIHGYTPLHRASDEAEADHEEALLCLLKHGAAVNTHDDYLQTPLIHAAHKAGTGGVAEVVDALLRAGADETIECHGGLTAADVIGEDVEEADRLADDIERVRELLANAPADGAWRRRGYLVLCSAHPDRLQQSQMIRGTHRNNLARRTRSRSRLARAGEVAGGSTVDGSTGGDWADMVAKVLQLQEEGIFRTIVGYL